MQDDGGNRRQKKRASSVAEVIGVVLVGLGTVAGFLGIWHNRQNRPSPAPISIMKLPSGQIVPPGDEEGDLWSSQRKENDKNFVPG